LKLFTDTFNLLWYDTLNLTNGICFLKLFERMAIRQKKLKGGRNRKKSRGTNGISGGSTSALEKKETKRRLLAEDENEEQKTDRNKTVGTEGVREILNPQNSVRSSINDDPKVGEQPGY
jgi:hypothetical protein